MLMSHHGPQHLLEAEDELGHCRDCFCHSARFNCSGIQMLHLPLLQKFILLGDHKQALWMLSGSSPCTGMLAIRLQLNPEHF